LLSSALSRPLTRRIAHQNDNTGDVKPGKEGHLIGGLSFFMDSIHHFTALPRQRLANIYPGSSRCGC
ncbi:hypothetical protein, partial [Klebsiella pneumoniae]|uniref:hypothetical protein n=2 Tax=Klebsiella pneumoniae TaxID=573 RepID=UPI001C941532